MGDITYGGKRNNIKEKIGELGRGRYDVAGVNEDDKEDRTK